jgi:hypothetical protein
MPPDTIIISLALLFGALEIYGAMCIRFCAIDQDGRNINRARQLLQGEWKFINSKSFFEIDSRGLYHKTYYGRNLQISVIS